MMKKNGFTLIELLAVIIILGILMIIAIPSVTKYINDARKDSYIDSAKGIITGAKNLVNDGKLEMFDTDTTYYIDYKCIKTEGASKSPYGEFTKAYVVVTYDGKGYDYYWTSVDDAGQGINNIIKMDKLEAEMIKSDLQDSDIQTTFGIDGRNKYMIIDESNNCGKGTANVVTGKVDGETGKNLVCKKAKNLRQLTCRSGAACDYQGHPVGVTMSLGQIPQNGSLKAGDAFDCDVNYDGVFDENSERFYFITTNGGNAVLLYYVNITGTSMVAYDSGGENWNGPRTAVTYLPTTSQWKNPGLVSPGKRQIIDDFGNTQNSGGHSYANFDYSGYAARFITYQEIESACYNGTTPIYRYNSLYDCPYLFENTVFANNDVFNVNGFWTETPFGDTIDTVNGVHAGGALVDFQTYYGKTDSTANYGVRPAIEVSLSQMDY